ncbi:DNA alkylation repair protein [Candidatus Saccharibacteria bacterium]|nr:DNA alkylation repair protein [Candidatus Saccharibacteria bacterium]MBQ7040667.1 DNA alkylation repair protein [Candidatus Saccharibacteria bacterium]
MNSFELKLREKLEDRRDLTYAEFVAKGIPGFPPEYFLGVRVPEIRLVADEMLMLVFGEKRWSSELTVGKNAGVDMELYHGMNNFLQDLPHSFLEYDYAHVEIISQMNNFSECKIEVEKFLPFVRNWAVCDCFNPKVFKRNLDEVLLLCLKWLQSERAFTVRYGVVMMMRYFLDERFAPDFLVKVCECVDREFPEMVGEDRRDLGEINKSSGKKSTETGQYYVEMAVAWYLATALFKQWEAALEILTEERLPVAVHNKAIQKAIESRRISPERKEFLRGIKR